jgi:hypothetical protein
MKLFRQQPRDGDRLELDGFNLRLRVNPRARRLSVRIDSRAGEAVATAPSARRLADAVEFARSRGVWVRARLGAVQGPDPLADRIELLGVSCPLAVDGRRPSIAWRDDGLPAAVGGCGQGEIDRQLITRAVRQVAHTVFKARATHHCARLRVAEPVVGLFDARTRWGSCTPPRGARRGAIRLSWRLALAPFAVADYVVAHECAHLVEANHSPRFWALVGELAGDHRPHRAYLRLHGGRLHRF